MRRPSGRILTGVVCSMMLAGCGQPDLTVTANMLPGYTCDDGHLGLHLSGTIENKGPGTAVLAPDWTKPWLTAYPSVKIPLFVQPYQTGTKDTAGQAVTLNPGDFIIVPIDAKLPPAPGGSAYDLIIEVDPSNAIAETNENNNTGKIAIPAHVCE
jgi:hypothetical protein